MVEIAADRDLPRKAEVQLPNGIILEESVAYKWIPTRCRKCISFGHSEDICPMIQKWIPIASIPQKETLDSSKAPSGDNPDTVCQNSQMEDDTLPLYTNNSVVLKNDPNVSVVERSLDDNQECSGLDSIIPNGLPMEDIEHPDNLEAEHQTLPPPEQPAGEGSSERESGQKFEPSINPDVPEICPNPTEPDNMEHDTSSPNSFHDPTFFMDSELQKEIEDWDLTRTENCPFIEDGPGWFLSEPSSLNPTPLLMRTRKRKGIKNYGSSILSTQKQ